MNYPSHLYQMAMHIIIRGSGTMEPMPRTELIFISNDCAEKQDSGQ